MNQNFETIDGALQRFGLGSFRPGQREVIEAIAAGHDCLCVMPTGGGKSLCYQLPSLIRPGLTIVVSPLIALMKDQVDSLGRNGIPAALINSTLSHSEQQQRLQDVAAGKYQLVYVAPERLRNPRFLEAIRATPIQLLAIDEAHCISQWGHDFRPDYTRIGQFREWLGGVQTVALTATATPRVRQDIMDVLGLKKPRQFMSGFARPNLHFGVLNCPSDSEKQEELEKFLKTNPGSGIIYSATRKRCEELVEWLANEMKIPVGAYHAGLHMEQRRVIQERFMNNQLRIIVATNAFGMGIDKPDLRFVIHYNMPGSLEAYYQEAGRAGRDGHDSLCVMLYSMQDRYIQEFFIENNYPPRDVIQSVYEFLRERPEDPIELTLEQIREEMGAQVSAESIGSCLGILARTRILERLEAGGGLAMIRINSDLPTLVELFPSEAKVRRHVLRLLERAVGDRRFEDVFVHPRWLLQESGIERDTLQRALREINKLEDVEYVPPFRGRAVHFRRTDVPFEELDIDFVALKKRMDAEFDRLNQVVQYAQSPLCRQASILNYFGDPDAKPCGQCDRCNRKPGWPAFKLTPVSSDAKQRAEQVKQSVETNLQKTPNAAKPLQQLPDAVKLAFLVQVMDAVARVHGRLGKHLIAQYLCGSNNAKVQKLNLHRLSSFGLLQGFRQDDGVELLDAMLAAGLLRQEEVNRHRPTVSISPQLTDLSVRDQLLQSLELPPALAAKIARIAGKTAQTGTNSQASSSAKPSSTPTTGNRTTAADSGITSATRTGSTASTSRAQQVIYNPTERLASESGQGARTGPMKAGSNFTSDSASTTPGTTKLQAEVRHEVPPTTHVSNSPAKAIDTGREPQSELEPPQRTQPVLSDWQWTVELFRRGFDWESVMAIRRLSDIELASSLCSALAAGTKMERPWLTSADGMRSAGQQRVVREIQRRANAGV